jgi:NOL1/NOP2/fmu family ribosome biogenesis protein
MFRKEPSMRKEWSLEFVERCAVDQQRILEDARRLVRPGGKLVYSTCTFNSDENEAVIASFLENHPEYEIEAPIWETGFFPGREDQVNAAGAKLHQAARLWPHQSAGEGHFIAVLRKNALADDELEATDRPFLHTELDSQHQVDVDAFWDQNLTLKERPSLSVVGNHLYAIPSDIPDLRGLTIIHWGWWLGVMKKNRLDPSHAFAMGVRSQDVRRTYPLSGDDPKATAFLRGEVLRFPGPDGWMMVTIDDHPLGWGKRVNGRIKSHVPNWLRYL